MPDQMQADSASVSTLVSGIVQDAQQLVRQEMALARQEIKEEINKAIVAAVSFAVAGVVGVVGCWMVCLMLVYLLWSMTGHRDDASVPLWGCYGIVAALFLAVGTTLFYIAKSKASQIDLIPRRTVESVKENVQWIKNQT